MDKELGENDLRAESHVSKILYSKLLITRGHKFSPINKKKHATVFTSVNCSGLLSKTYTLEKVGIQALLRLNYGSHNTFLISTLECERTDQHAQSVNQHTKVNYIVSYPDP